MGAVGTLLTPQQWRFVDAVIKGKTYSEAYAKAGYKTTKGNNTDSAASRLSRNVKVEAAIVATRRAAAQRAEITVDTIVERLEEIRRVALEVDPPQASAAVAAVMGQAKVLGLVIDRSQVDITHHKPAPFPTKILELSQDEWLAQFDKSTPQKKIANTPNDR